MELEGRFVWKCRQNLHWKIRGLWAVNHMAKETERIRELSPGVSLMGLV